MKSWTIVLKNPTVKGGATGEQLTWASSFLADGVEFNAGTEYDHLKVRMMSTEKHPAVTTY